MSREEVPQYTPTPGLERVVFFSDAVFAIVITLLVLPLTVDSRLPQHGSQFAGQLSAFGPKIFTFVISFMVIGRFWMVHHRMFGLFRRHDESLLLLNLLILLSISFMLFPTAILGAQGDATSREPGMFYAASMTLTSVMFTLTWLYASRAGLVAESVTREQVSALTIRSCVTTAVFALSIAAAMLSLWAAMFCWLLLMPIARSLMARYSARRENRAQPAAGATPP
jgi:uncharacterized membrane protein